MAATVRKFQDLISGTTTTNPLLIGGTTLNGAALASLIAIADPNFIAITLDPEGAAGAPEIVWVTAHTGASTSATILRAQEGTTARQHDSGTKFVVALTKTAIENMETATATALAAANEADDTADAAMVVADAAQTAAEVLAVFDAAGKSVYYDSSTDLSVANITSTEATVETVVTTPPSATTLSEFWATFGFELGNVVSGSPTSVIISLKCNGVAFETLTFTSAEWGSPTSHYVHFHAHGTSSSNSGSFSATMRTNSGVFEVEQVQFSVIQKRVT